jgi:hypothetical protein
LRARQARSGLGEAIPGRIAMGASFAMVCSEFNGSWLGDENLG